MPTTTTVEIKASGGDYTTLASMIADNGGLASKDLPTEDAKLIVECYNEDFSGVGGHANGLDEATAFTTAWTTDKAAGQYIEINCPSSEKHDGTPASGFYITTDSSAAAVIQAGNNVEVDIFDLDLVRTGSINYRGLVRYEGVGNTSLTARCLLRNETSVKNFAAIFVSALRGGVVLRASVLDGGPNRAAVGFDVGGFVNPYLENVVIARADVGVAQGNSSTSYKIRVRNVVTWDCTNFYSDAGGGFLAGTGYNATDDYSGQAPPDEVGSSNYTSDVVSGDFVDAANGDFHLASGSALYDIGVDLSADFDYDIDNDTGIDWSIGMDAGQAGGTTHEGSLTLALELDQAETNNAILDAGITFAQQMSDTPSSNAIAEASLNLAAQLGDTHAANTILLASAIYSSQLNAAITGAVTGDIEGALALNLNLAESLSPDATLGASALFANQLSLSLAGGQSIASAVTMALTTGAAMASDISIEGSLLLNLESSIAQSTDAVLAAAIALDVQLTMAAISQGVLNAGLSLSCVQSVTVSGSTVVAGIVTPDGRTLTVSADTRTISVGTGNRTITVNSD